MHPTLNRILGPMALVVAAAACHNDEDCVNDVAPAGVKLEVVPETVVSNEGCDGVGATLDDSPLTYTTGEPVNAGARNKCLVETLLNPDAKELYGVRIDFCSADWNGFQCEGHLVGCAAQSARLRVGLLLDGSPDVGRPTKTPYFVYVSADQQDDCPRVDCKQEFEATTTRL